MGDTVRVRKEGAASRLPSVKPMLATAGPLPPQSQDTEWGFELKWDGIRAITYVQAGSLRLLSRTDRDMTGSYPELAGLAAAAAEPLVLDGEIVAMGPAGRPSFSTLQQRMQVAFATPALVAQIPVTYLIFDVLYAGGRSMLDVPFAQRREVLEQLALAGSRWQTPPSWTGGGPQVLAVSQQQGLEGVVAKRLASLYRPGVRSAEWVKVKNVRVQEAVVGGWSPGQGRRAGAIGSLLIGIPDPPGNDELARGGGLRYIGHVGTGFTAVTLADLGRRLAPLHQEKSPFTVGGGVPREHARGVRWVRPELVGDVAYGEWTIEDVLRHPSWKGLRPDKTPAEVYRD